MAATVAGLRLEEGVVHKECACLHLHMCMCLHRCVCMLVCVLAPVPVLVPVHIAELVHRFFWGHGWGVGPLDELDQSLNIF